MRLEQAKKMAKSGVPVYAEYYGPGWSMVVHGKDFYDRNPHTGSLLLHRFDERDEKAEWSEGLSPSKTEEG